MGLLNLDSRFESWQAGQTSRWYENSSTHLHWEIDLSKVENSKYIQGYSNEKDRYRNIYTNVYQ